MPNIDLCKNSPFIKEKINTEIIADNLLKDIFEIRYTNGTESIANNIGNIAAIISIKKLEGLPNPIIIATKAAKMSYRGPNITGCPNGYKL